MFLLLTNLGESKAFGVYSYSGRKVIYELIGAAVRVYNECNGSGKDWITTMSLVISDILLSNELLAREVCKVELQESSLRIIEDMISHEVDVENLSVEDLGLYARNTESIHLLTMHKAKGLEYEAVALIDLHNGKLPHFKAETEADIEDSRRLFYVSITRAKKILMYFTDQEDGRNRPSPFLGAWGLGYQV